MKFTGEFFVPADTDTDSPGNIELEIEHKQRYLSILSLVAGKDILDIASGEGYGTHLLSAHASSAIGIDINPELVQHASDKYRQDNLSYRHGSVTNIPLEDHSIDILVSFETLEHVDAIMQRTFLSEAKRVLKDEGILIISTPNKKNYTDRYDHHNSFHVHELDRTGFADLLNAHFGHVVLYEQGLEVTSLLLRKEDYLSGKNVALLPLSGNYRFESKYLVALCCDQPEPIRTPIASVIPESERSYFQLIDRILDLQREVEQLGAWGTRSAAETQELAQEVTRSRESSQTDRSEIDRLIRELAVSNHQLFIARAELEARQKLDEFQPAYTSDMARFAEEFGRLSDSLSTNKNLPRSRSSGLPATPNNSASDPSAKLLQEELIRLQKDLAWYRSTYEERSLLGILKQKIFTRRTK